MRWLDERAEYRRAIAQARAKGAAWRADHALRPPSGEPVVFFAIPLISRARATDWTRIVANLKLTLDALRRQTDPGWRAYVCSQDRPEGIAFDDQARFLPYETTDVVSQDARTRFDNHAKRGSIADAIADTHSGDGYFFPLDADDILHPELVRHIRDDDNGRGYLVDRGYMWDVQTGDLAPLRPGPAARLRGIRPFNRECGSCTALRLDLRDGPDWLAMLHGNGRHKWVGDTWAAMGFPLAPVPFPAALYAVNHGENMRQIRGKLGPKLRYVRRHRIADAHAARIRAAFGLPG